MYSKSDRANNYYFELEKEIEELSIKAKKSHYKGVKTHLQSRIEKLENKSLLCDQIRFSYFLKDFSKFTGLI